MSFELTFKNTTKDKNAIFNSSYWRHILRVAFMNGWEPQGTSPNEELLEVEGIKLEDWDGTYFDNGGQFVKDEDSKNIANALEKALQKDTCLLRDRREFVKIIKLFKTGGFWIF